jgi:hypothetical protein
VKTIPIITFGQMRDQGVHKVVVYCRNHHCNHHTVVNADRWPDHDRLSDVGPKLTCSACGKRGADISPRFKNGPRHR